MIKIITYILNVTIHYKNYQTETTATVFTWYFRLFLHRSKAIITEYKAAVAKAKPPKSLKEATSPKASIERPPKSPPKPRPTPKYADPKIAYKNVIISIIEGERRKKKCFFVPPLWPSS